MPATPEIWPLATLQSRVAAALMAAGEAERDLPEALFAGALPGAEGLRVHRNTVLGALSHSLRLGYPAVDRLVGEAFFDRMAVEFARAQPPTAPQLGAWGAAFAAFIDRFPGTEQLPYLSELARFDARFDELARRVADTQFRGTRLAVGEGVQLCFVAGLLVHTSTFPVSALRDAIFAEDAVTLASIDARPAAFHYAMWRERAGVLVRPLQGAAAGYLKAALAGADGGQALAAALAAAGDAKPNSVPAGEAEIAMQLQQEVLQAGFVRVTTID
jgi:hypothetical protein